MNFVLLQAQGQAASQQGGGLSFLILIVLMFVIMYLFFVLPERKRRKQLEQFRSQLKPGDPVMTIGGIYGIVDKIEDKYILLEVDKNVKIKIDKNSIVKEPSISQKK